MNQKTNVLLLEDNLIDAELIERELRRAGFEFEARRVDTEAEFVAALAQPVDLVLADYRLPQFDGLQALRHVQQRGLDVPFIIISAALGDELAAQCIKQGVTDYLVKDRLDRLGLAVTNALEERRLRVERTLVEEQLRQAQKMEAIGQLAGGIAHDFNNVLTVINGWSQILLEETAAGETTREAAKQIHAAGQRASTLTRQLLFFTRKRPIERIAVDLNHTIEEVAAMLRRLIGEHIDLSLELAPVLPPVEADVSMMEQVLINLTVNARDAMPQGGRLRISTATTDVTATDHRGSDAAAPGRYVRLRVEDTGSGISPDALPHIFEPFFTTKEIGKGTGVGLATVLGIVKQHAGWIDLESKVGAGTVFTVFLPAADATRGAPEKTAAPHTAIGGGRETLLIVEDEPSVREFAAAVLRPLGYRLLQARTGLDALEIWKRHAAQIDLLLTDIVMPDQLTGPQLAAKLVAQKPSLSVVFTSGYSQESIVRAFPPEKGARFIHKPYSPRALAKIVRETLDRRPLGRAAVSTTP